MKTELPTPVDDFCKDDVNINAQMSGEENIEESDHSKDEEDDTCIEITPAAEKTPDIQDVNTVNKRNKQSGTTASKQNNSESTPKVTNVENNQTQKGGPKIHGSLYERHKERI